MFDPEDLARGVLEEFAERAAFGDPLRVPPDGYHIVTDPDIANECARRDRAKRAGREVRPAIAERPTAGDRLAQKRAWWHRNKNRIRPPKAA